MRKRTKPSEAALAAAKLGFEPRIPLLKELARRLEDEARVALRDLPHVDRIGFRAKAADSYAHKSLALEEDGTRKYAHPLEEIEDQVGGRVIVFFRRDMALVIEKLKATFSTFEQTRKSPSDPRAFAYESEHLVFGISPLMYPPGWTELAERPTTFEMQVRTLAMHAWAEPQHDVAYKPDVELSDEETRKVAWAASSAWGIDSIFEEVLLSIEGRGPDNDGGDPGSAGHAKQS